MFQPVRKLTHLVPSKIAPKDTTRNGLFDDEPDIEMYSNETTTQVITPIGSHLFRNSALFAHDIAHCNSIEMLSWFCQLCQTSDFTHRIRLGSKLDEMILEAVFYGTNKDFDNSEIQDYIDNLQDEIFNIRRKGEFLNIEQTTTHELDLLYTLCIEIMYLLREMILNNEPVITKLWRLSEQRHLESMNKALEKARKNSKAGKYSFKPVNIKKIGLKNLSKYQSRIKKIVTLLGQINPNKL